MNRTAPIIGLAVLKTNWDVLGRDYVENFVPIVADCLRFSSDEVVSLPKLQEDVQERYGIKLPQNPLRQIVRRATKSGFVRVENGVFYRVLERCNALAVDESRKRVNAVYARTVSRLRDYAQKNHRVTWSESDAEEALAAFLLNDSLAMLFSYSEATVFDFAPKETQARYIIGSLIAESHRSDSELMNDLLILAQGNMLANAMYLPDPGRVAKRFESTRVYLDTSIIVYAAGYAGAERAAPCRELIDLLCEYGAVVLCFQNTLDEIHGILDACAARLERGQLREAFGPSMEYFIETGRTASDVELMTTRLKSKLDSFGIQVEDKHPYEKEYQVDEAGFEDALNAAINYQNKRALVHDVDCISAIARLRRGRDRFSQRRRGHCLSPLMLRSPRRPEGSFSRKHPPAP